MSIAPIKDIAFPSVVQAQFSYTDHPGLGDFKELKPPVNDRRILLFTSLVAGCDMLFQVTSIP